MQTYRKPRKPGICVELELGSTDEEVQAVEIIEIYTVAGFW